MTASLDDNQWGSMHPGVLVCMHLAHALPFKQSAVLFDEKEVVEVDSETLEIKGLVLFDAAKAIKAYDVAIRTQFEWQWQDRMQF